MADSSSEQTTTIAKMLPKLMRIPEPSINIPLEKDKRNSTSEQLPLVANPIFNEYQTLCMPIGYHIQHIVKVEHDYDEGRCNYHQNLKAIVVVGDL